MLDRPSVSDEQIAATLRGRYALKVEEVDFLALGHDAHAWAFRASVSGGEAVFVKIRRSVDAARLAVPRVLRDQGISAAVAPIATSDGALSAPLDGLHLIVYPFVEGTVAAEVGLTDQQWVEYGAIVGAIHRARLTPDLEALLPHERFSPAWRAAIGPLDEAITAYQGDDPSRIELAAFWAGHRDEILRLARRALALGESLLERLGGKSGEAFVPCHGDIHSHNLLVDPGGALRVFDWDDCLLAPPERDLMFVMGSPIGLAPGKREFGLFEAGYGSIDVDPVKLAYYHTDWAIQDVVGYAEQVMFDDITPGSRAYALRVFRTAFMPGDEIDVAHRFDREASARLGDDVVTLRQPEERDIDAIDLGIHDPDVVHWFGRPTASAQEVFELNRRRWADMSGPTFTITERDNACVGLAWVNVHDGQTRVGDVGYWLLPTARGRGLATRAVRLLAPWAIDDLGLDRLRLLTEPENLPSQRVAERAGFMRQGVVAGHGEIDGRAIDHLVFEWPLEE
jgi:spectinomycin phosphotransferase